MSTDRFQYDAIPEIKDELQKYKIAYKPDEQRRLLPAPTRKPSEIKYALLYNSININAVLSISLIY